MGDHDVNVRRPVGVAAHESEQISRRTRGVNGIFGGLEAVEPELAILVGSELAAQVVTGLVLGVEDVVFAIGAGLPHVQDRIGDSLASLGVTDDAVEKGQLAVLGHVLNHTGAQISEWRFGRPEGSEDGGGCGVEFFFRHNLVVDLVDQASGAPVLACL